MGNHFRRPEEGQGAPDAPLGGQIPPATSHFSLSSDSGEPQQDQSRFEVIGQEGAPSAPATGYTPSTLDPGDTGAFLASAGVTRIETEQVPNPAPLSAASMTGAIPDPADPFAAPEVTSDQAEEVADLDAALASPDFTSVFAPVGDSRKKMAREAGVEPVILMEHVTKIYPAQPNKPALDDVNLEIYPGEFVFLVGHSGSGKSTFIRLLNRELKATSGQVLVAGQDLTVMKNRKVPLLRRQIGCVFQDFKLLTDKTTYENVAFALECIGKPKSVIKVQVPEVLRLVGLEEKMNNYPDQLSGGEQQRVSVARAMVNRPPLLICDEPTGNLDPAISLGIMRLLELINRNGTTVVMATHDREMVDSMRKRVIALEGGEVVRDQERGGYGNYGTV